MNNNEFRIKDEYEFRIIPRRMGFFEEKIAFS